MDDLEKHYLISYMFLKDMCVILQPSIHSNGIIILKLWNQNQIIEFLTVWPWNLTDDLEKQYGTSFMPLQA